MFIFPYNFSGHLRRQCLRSGVSIVNFEHVIADLDTYNFIYITACFSI